MATEQSTLRVLLVIESCGGGSARHVVDLAAGLIELGNEVEVAYSPLRADGWFLEELQALDGLELHALEMQRNPGLKDARSMRELRALISARGPFDVIHGHSAKAGALVRLAGVNAQAIKVYTPHAFITLDSELGIAKKFLYSTAERFLARFANGIICVSNEEREHAAGLGIKEKLLFTVENGLVELPAADREQARAQLQLTESDVCLGFVGRLSGQKPVARLVKAFHLLHLQFPELVLAIIGDGPDFQHVKGLVEALNISDRVRLTGPANGPFLMAGFDVFVLPSNYEAFPYVYLEALARSLPIISTNVGGSHAVVDEGLNGYIVSQDALDLLTVRIAKLMQNAELRFSMAARSFEKSKYFTVDNMVQQTIGVYRQLLNAG